jgi:site-specific DNA-methyltransferase (adenine-specific)
MTTENATKQSGGAGIALHPFVSPFYDNGGITIYHGDCREIVPGLGLFDLLLTDPPYGINRSGQPATNCKNPKHNRKLHEDFGWDTETPEKWVFDMLRSHAENSIVWGANYFPQFFEPRMGWLVWDKGQDFSTSDCELAFGSFDKALRRLVLNRGEINRDGSQHPTQKPERLIKWCIEQAGDVQTILDPFAGSGTTGRAAKDLGKRAVLIEREEKYCEIAAHRLSQEVLSLS